MVDLTISVSLSDLQKDLGAIFDLGDFQAGGSLEDLRIKAEREDALIKLTVQGHGNFLSVQTPDGLVDLGNVGIDHQSQIRTVDDRLAELSVRLFELTSDLGDLNAVGQYRADDGAYDRSY